MVQACITMELSQQEQGYSEITGNGRVHTMTISDYIKLALVIIHKYMYVYFEEIRKLIIIYYPLPKLADNKVAQNQSVISGFFS